MIISYKGMTPKIAESAWIAENAVVSGNVEIGENCSVWFGAVIRGDGDAVRIGNNTNIQDNSVVHLDLNGKAVIGDNVTIGHGCIIHNCEIGDGCLVGMGAIIMNNAKIGNNSLVGAGTLVTEGKEFPDNSLIVGSPAKFIRELTEDEKAAMLTNVGFYTNFSEVYGGKK